jgi:ABC-2 type transport system permease protein
VPVLILLLATLGIGVGMLLSALYVRYRDIQPIWDVISQGLFYASPVIYTAAQYKSFVHIAMLNPIAVILTQVHAALIGDTPGAAYWIGGSIHLLIPLGLIGAMFVLGLWFFTREAPRIAENL